MTKSEKVTIDDLRAHAKTLESFGNYLSGAEYAQVLAATKTMINASNYLSEQIDRDNDWVEFEKECVEAIGSDVFGHRVYHPGDETDILEGIKAVHKYYAERLRVLNDHVKKLEKDLATYKRIANMKKGQKNA